MSRILVTGGRGFLGSDITARLVSAGHTVRVMSHSSEKPARFPDVEWVRADLATQTGLKEAVKDIEIIVNSASGALKNAHEVDVFGTQKLLEYARSAGVKHVAHVSIIGIDRIPFSYYQHKLAAEQVIRESGVPWSIVRAAQFHYFIDAMLTIFNRVPLIMPMPTDFHSQPMDVSEAAARMVEVATMPPAGMLPEIAGPEVLSLGEMAKVWRAAKGIHRPMVHLPLFVGWADGFRKALNTNPQARYGKITWAEWVQKTYGAQQENNPSIRQTV